MKLSERVVAPGKVVLGVGVVLCPSEHLHLFHDSFQPAVSHQRSGVRHHDKMTKYIHMACHRNLNVMLISQSLDVG